MSLVFALVMCVQDPQEIVEKAISSHGDVTKLRRARIQTEGTHVQPGVGEIPLKLEDAWELPDRYRVTFRYEINKSSLTQIIILNENQGWVCVDGQPHDLDLKSLAEMREQLYAESLDKLYPLREKGLAMSAIEGVEVNGRSAVGIKVSSKGHRDVRLYFDKESGLLVKRAEKIVNAGEKETLREVMFLDHREFDGVRYGGRILGYYDGEKTLDLKVVKLEFPARFEPTTFSKP